MRLQKTQLPSEKKLVIGQTNLGDLNFRRSLYSVAGYANYDVTLVGAAGGKSGNGAGSSSANMAYGAGGGGGGLLRVVGSLKDLPENVFMIPGTAGAHGTDSSNTKKAGDGIKGGDSQFNTLKAFGGDGGIGGRIDQVGGGVGYVPSEGGDGGGNSLGMGGGGIGGNKGGYPPPTAPTTGTSEISGSTYGGIGGGGGTGRTKVNNSNENDAQDGRNGNNGNSVGGLAGTVASSKGGSGGGANIKIFTGSATDEVYGSYATGADPNGVVYLKLS